VDAPGPATGPGSRPAGDGALAIATWDFGLKAVEVAGTLLAGGADLLDAVEKGVIVIEDDPRVTSVGLGGLPNEDGIVELDGAIMIGRTLEAGSVASLRRIRNPISVARRIMERTHHVMLVGDEARRFAVGEGFQEEDLLTDEARRQWREWKRDPQRRTFWKEVPAAAGAGHSDAGAPAGAGTPTASHDTVGLIVRDARGRLCVGMSTSGLEWKLPGRVGDTPLIGCGLYADDEAGAAAGTGVGEAIIRAAGSHSVVEAMRHGRTPQQACEDVVRRILKRDPGLDRRVAFIAVSRSGAVGAASSDPEFSYGLHRGGKSSIVPVRPIRA
jgi:isoaspartyl peptidase/L-asparaginase-like protein (Ntn-hydrolase superfamily)